MTLVLEMPDRTQRFYNFGKLAKTVGPIVTCNKRLGPSN